MVEQILSALLEYFSVSIPRGDEWRPAVIVWVGVLLAMVVAAVFWIAVRS